MEEREKEKFQRLLLKEKLRIFENLGFLESSSLENRGESGISTHPAELGTDNFEKDLGLDLASNEGILLQRINESLEKIEKGTYGLCEECGKRISKKRLLALPYANLCYSCQQKTEK